jgi:hypothetical protein
MGGLGNQLFQIFATISYCIDQKQKFLFLNVESLGDGKTKVRPTYWKTFFHHLETFLISKLPFMKIVREIDFTYNKIPKNEIINEDIILYGYFQSYKYFQNHYYTIYRLLGIDNMKSSVIKKMDKNNTYFTNTISIHFRLGDYKLLKDFYSILSYNYYIRSLQYIQNINLEKDFVILYFCEKEDLEEVLLIINKLETYFPMYTFVRANCELEDWEQLLLMSCCKHNIIANSTFSWWGAYFNNNSQKIVCYPSTWFGENTNMNTKDLCPSNWIKINTCD